MTQTDTSQLTVGILAQGFIDDPMLSFLFPDPVTRFDALTEWFQLFVADGFQRGTVRLTAAAEGAIIWYPATVKIVDASFNKLLNEAAIIVERFAGSVGVNRFEHLGKAISSTADSPYLEVFWLAIKPEARGQGLGGHLLQAALQQADAAQVGTYLVSSNPHNIGFYERYGFRQLESLLVDKTLPLTQMWRNPQTSTPT